MWTIGIDIGTTTISAVVMKTRSNEMEKAYTLANDSFLESKNFWEKIQNPDRIIDRAVRLLDEILAEYQEIDAIGLTGQMHGILYLDREGMHISPLYTWQDESGSQKCIEDVSVCEYLYQNYQEKLYSGYGLATYLYHVMTKQVPTEAEKICTIMDYLGMRLTGRKTPLIHVSNAASLGLFDAEKECFIKEIIKSLHGDESILPDVANGMELLGSCQGIPVSVAIGDNQASFLGSVNEIESTLLVNVGTGSQVSVFSKNYCNINGIETRPFIENDYLLVGSSLCGGRAYALLEQFFRSYAKALGQEGTSQYEVMEKLLLAEKQRGDKNNEKLKVTTTFSGTRENPEKRGSISNISTENFTPTALIEGVLEGMSDELHDMYRLMVDCVEKPLEKMTVSGNGIRKNPYLQEIISQKFSMPMQLSEQKEEAAYGAALSGTFAIEKK